MISEKDFEKWLEGVSKTAPRKRPLPIVMTGWRKASEIMSLKEESNDYIAKMIAVSIEDHQREVIKKAIDEGIDFSLRIEQGRVVSNVDLNK